MRQTVRQCAEGVTLRVFGVTEKRVLHTSCWAAKFADAVLTHDSLSFIFFLHSRWFPPKTYVAYVVQYIAQYKYR